MLRKIYFSSVLRLEFTYLVVLPLMLPMSGFAEVKLDHIPISTREKLSLVFQAIPRSPESITYTKGFFSGMAFRSNQVDETVVNINDGTNVFDSEMGTNDGITDDDNFFSNEINFWKSEVFSHFASLYICQPLMYVCSRLNGEDGRESSNVIIQQIDLLELDAIVHVGFQSKNVFPFFQISRTIPNGVELDFFFFKKSGVRNLLDYYRPFADKIEDISSCVILEFCPKKQEDGSDYWSLFATPPHLKNLSHEDMERIGNLLRKSEEGKKLFITVCNNILVLCTDKDILTKTITNLQKQSGSAVEHGSNDGFTMFTKWVQPCDKLVHNPIDFRSRFWSIRIFDKILKSETDFYSPLNTDENAFCVIIHEKIPVSDSDDTTIVIDLYSNPTEETSSDKAAKCNCRTTMVFRPVEIKPLAINETFLGKPDENGQRPLHIGTWNTKEQSETETVVKTDDSQMFIDYSKTDLFGMTISCIDVLRMIAL